jgi:hypothetical protein
MFQTQLRSCLLAVAVLATVVFGLLGLGYAFGADLSCTNHFNCTGDWCPSVCARATVGFWLNTVGQVCLFTWLVIAAGGRRFVAPLWGLVAAANLSVAVLALSSLVTASANRW